MDDMMRLAKSYLRGIATKAEFMALLEELMISDIERDILIGVYLDHHNLDLIASSHDFSLPSIKKYHRSALIKVNNYIQKL